MFDQVTTLQSGSKKMTDWSRNTSFPKLANLWISGPSDESLARFDSGALETASCFGGRLSAFDISATEVWVFGMRRLRTFGDVATRRLKVESCSKMDLDSLGNVKGLQQLGLPPSDLLKLDFGPLFSCRSLQTIETAAELSEIREVAKRLPSTVRIGIREMKVAGLLPV